MLRLSQFIPLWPLALEQARRVRGRRQAVSMQGARPRRARAWGRKRKGGESNARKGGQQQLVWAKAIVFESGGAPTREKDSAPPRQTLCFPPLV
eukprot:6212541-Pleurochrysis_carterae.AAC.4